MTTMHKKIQTFLLLSACITLSIPATAQIAASPVITTTHEYDAEGQVTRQINGLNQSERYQWDRLGNLTAQTDGAEGTAKIIYDRRGNPISVTAPNGATTTTTYDGFGNLLTETSPDRGITRYTYNDNGQRIQRSDARNHTLAYTYDNAARLIRTDAYDEAGNTSHEFRYGWDTPLSPNTYGWNPPMDPGASVTYGIGRLIQLTSYHWHPAGHTSSNILYDHHPDGSIARQRIALRTPQGTHTLTTTWQQRPNSPKTQTLTYPSGTVLQYTYNTYGRLTGLTWDNAPVAANIEYEPFGPPNAWTLANGIDTIRATDTAGHPVAYTLNHDTVELLHDGAGRITTIKDKRTTRLHDYDAAGRLTTYTTPSTTLAYTYDANGNRTGQTLNGVHTPYTYTPNTNRLTHVDTQQLTYDAAGNLLTDGQYQYTYDSTGRLASVEPGAIRYDYNALGQRYYKRTQDSARLYNYDLNGQLLGEYDATTGKPLVEYAWLNNIPVAIKRYAGTTSQIFAIETDHLNAPRRVSDTNNNTRWTWGYGPFGDTPPNTNPENLGAFEFNLRFPGQYHDEEIGLFYNYFRSYHPALGRYTQSDPIGLEGGMNTFAYVGGNPISYVDPEGLVAGAASLSGLGGAGAGSGGAAAGLTILGGAAVVAGTGVGAYWLTDTYVNPWLQPVIADAIEWCTESRGRGERGASGGSSGNNTDNPYKHCRDHPTEPTKILCKHHQTGKEIPKEKPPNWNEIKKKNK